MAWSNATLRPTLTTDDWQPNDTDLVSFVADDEDDDDDSVLAPFDELSAAAWAHSFSNQLTRDWSKKSKRKPRQWKS